MKVSEIPLQLYGCTAHHKGHDKPSCAITGRIGGEFICYERNFDSGIFL